MSTQGSRLREIRKILNLSQEEMGKIFNATKSYISLIERDKCKLSVNHLEKLLIDYNISLNYLIGGIGNPFLNEKYNDIKSEILGELEKIFKEKGIK